MFSIVVCARSESSDYYMLTSSNPIQEEAQAEVDAQFEKFSRISESLEIVEVASSFYEPDTELGFVCFMEYNDHEGETWYTFVRTSDKLIPEYNKALGIRNKYPDLGIRTNGKGDLEHYTEAEVRALVNVSSTYYMEEYAIQELKPIDHSMPLDEFMYKRGCFK
jgi:hypothetical protein